VTDRDIKALYELKAAALARHPDLGATGGAALAVLGDSGLPCRVQLDGQQLEVDLPPEDGGSGAAAHPGQLMRAALGAALAFGYRIWAARLGVSVGRIEVAVRCDYDVRRELGVGPPVAPRWQRVTVDVLVSSSASQAEVQHVVAVANQHSPVLANLSADIAQLHRLSVKTAATERSVPPEVTPDDRERDRNPNPGERNEP
jgi:uncharacterized OsmC-like protein